MWGRRLGGALGWMALLCAGTSTAASAKTRSAGDEDGPACRYSGVAVSFDSKSSDLDINARGALNGVASWLKMGDGRTIRLFDGNADKTVRPNAGTRLAERRAAAVKDYLLGQGIDPERIGAVGAGDAPANVPESSRAIAVLTCETAPSAAMLPPGPGTVVPLGADQPPGGPPAGAAAPAEATPAPSAPLAEATPAPSGPPAETTPDPAAPIADASPETVSPPGAGGTTPPAPVATDPIVPAPLSEASPESAPAADPPPLALPPPVAQADMPPPPGIDAPAPPPVSVPPPTMIVVPPAPPVAPVPVSPSPGPQLLAPVPPPAAHHPSRPPSRLGVEATVGGGVTGFVDELARSVTNTGGSWDARMTFGTRLPVAVEVAYIGSAQGIVALGPGNAILLGNGTEGTLRINFTTAPIQPYVFGGGGWTHYQVTNTPAPLASMRSGDNVGTVPTGIGLSLRLTKELVIDLRGTYRFTFNDHLFDVPNSPAGTANPGLDSWNAIARIGFEF